MERKNKKDAYVDQILLWMMMFVGFVTIFFLVLDYSTIVRIKNNTDMLAQFGARMIALDRSNASIAQSMNNMKISYFADIAAGDINCTTTASTPGVNEYQVVLTITSTYTQSRVMNFNDTIESKMATFNEINSDFIDCTLSLSAQ